MNVLIVGSGAREHAIAWKLAQSPRLKGLYVAPGNAGTAAIADNLPLKATDVPALVEAARRHAIDLTIVGPEAPLAEGIVDRFEAEGLRIFGPTKTSAELEWSKAFAKEVMEKAGIPCARSRTFSSYADAAAYVERQQVPIVVKADGLAAGKGVVVAQTREEAVQSLGQMMQGKAFGDAGLRVVIEECLAGMEASVFAITDGTTALTTVPACDYKRVGDGDQGPNTGGMGSYSPPEFFTAALAEQARTQVLEPAIATMAAMGRTYRGVLYAGVMVTREGLKVLEFNCRLGDPETQVILPRLESDLLEVCLAVAERRLAGTRLRWSAEPCVGVVAASGDYPGGYRTGLPIHGLERVDRDALVFHAGARLQNGAVVTDGGRVLTVAAKGATMAQAREKAYANIKRISFEGMRYRRDIAARAVTATPPA